MPGIELDMGSWYEPPDPKWCCAAAEENEVCVCEDDDEPDGPYDTWQEWELDSE